MIIKRTIIFVISLFLYVLPVKAYEFTEIDMFVDTLILEYNGTLDSKKLFLTGGDTLNKADSSLKLYHSNSKAFLYNNNVLVRTFKFPKEENPLLWKDLLTDVLNAGIDSSQKIASNVLTLENDVIKRIANGLDKYSRAEKISATSDKLNYKLIDNVLYISSTLFYDGFSDYLKKIISTHHDIDGIILDLRNNHGGNFNEAIKTADLFLDNTLITYRESKNQPKHYYTSTAGDILEGKPIAILTNEQTASSAELVVAALHDQSRATLIGTKTYGKGTTQLVKKISQQQLFITNGVFFAPSGKPIDNLGILPQICTGINNSCTTSNKKHLNEDISVAINLIKNNFI